MCCFRLHFSDFNVLFKMVRPLFRPSFSQGLNVTKINHTVLELKSEGHGSSLKYNCNQKIFIILRTVWIELKFCY